MNAEVSTMKFKKWESAVLLLISAACVAAAVFAIIGNTYRIAVTG